ncbi:MAG TPA: hypothetical protein VGQ77_17285 [Methylomirabilota bacterium]|jgi:hypothetical protein|nr:hypothetical protein [Methylomirabilota bacterium]
MKSVTFLFVIACMTMVACATGPTKPPSSVDVTGTWIGEWVGSGAVGSGSVTMTLRQAGSSVTGDVGMSGGSPFSGPVSGTVSGDMFSMSYRGGSGDLTVKGNTMSGFTRYSRWTLQRQ